MQYLDPKNDLTFKRVFAEHPHLTNENTKVIPQELQDNKEIREAISHLQVASFTEEELAYYDQYWDSVRIEKTALDEKFLKGKDEEKKETAFRGFDNMLDDLFITKLTGLSTEQVLVLRKEWELHKNK